MPTELIIVTPQGESFRGPVDQVVLPGSEGEFGVLQLHERFLAPLAAGAAEIKTAQGSRWAALGSGFADVSAEQVVVLVDSCRLVADKESAQRESGAGAGSATKH